MIIAASCDDRAYEGLSRILKENIKIDKLFVLKFKEQKIEPQERIAQMVIAPYITAEFEEAAELSSTLRGEGGFGSTGTK